MVSAFGTSARADEKTEPVSDWQRFYVGTTPASSAMINLQRELNDKKERVVAKKGDDGIDSVRIAYIAAYLEASGASALLNGVEDLYRTKAKFFVSLTKIAPGNVEQLDAAITDYKKNGLGRAIPHAERLSLSQRCADAPLVTSVAKALAEIGPKATRLIDPILNLLVAERRTGVFEDIVYCFSSRETAKKFAMAVDRELAPLL